MARRRPSAFEVSFPEEIKKEEAAKKKREEDEKERERQEKLLSMRHQNQKKLRRQEKEREKQDQRNATRVVQKRREPEEDEVEVARPAKKPQLDLPIEHYASQPNELHEAARKFLEGEDELVSDSDSDPGSDASSNVRPRARPPKPKEKPIRLLTGFTIFDSRHRNEFVVLSTIEEEDGVDRRFEAAGWAVPYYLEAEDEDDLEVEEGGNGDAVEPAYMRIGPVLRYSVDWTKDRDPFYIETQHAWYVLRMPAEKYTPWYQAFYTARRIAQLLISSAIKRPHLGFDSFVHTILMTTMDIFGKRLEDDDLWNAAEVIRDAVDEVDKDNPETRLRRVPAIEHILRRAPPRLPNASSRRVSSHLRNYLKGPRGSMRYLGLGNPDLLVMKPENQNPTHVTPLIASLARGFVNEELIVVGPPPPKPDDMALEQQRRKAIGTLWRLVERARGGMLEVEWRKEDRFNQRSNYLRKVAVGGEVYQPGDYVLVPHGKYGARDPPEWPKDVKHLPSNATVGSYFWFARIMYIKNEEQIAHVQWLEHAPQTVLHELANIQELFFCNLCNPVPLGAIIAKAKVHIRPAGSIKADEYFVRYLFDKVLSTFTAINKDYHQHLEQYAPQNNLRNGGPILDYCPSCLVMEEDNHKLHWQYEPQPNDRDRDKGKGKEKEKENAGIVFGGVPYHIYDFVLYRAPKGPAYIGQIVDMMFPPRTTSRLPVKLKLKKVGRVCDLVGIIVNPMEEMKDERHVFLTDEETTIPYSDIITKCLVLSHESFGQRITMDSWLGASPHHFYIRYRFPKLIPTVWGEKTGVSFRELSVCKPCTEGAVKQYRDLEGFQTAMRERPLEVLDLFGGSGAFSLGLKEGSGCLKISHALEISPSAAKTHKRNCAGTQVINQCVNTVLRYVIKAHEGHHIERPTQLWDGRTPIPDPPKPGTVDVITAGFPCQTHSALNMFKTANDVKSNLMLTALSWIDYYRPKFVYLENVSGFLSFALNAKQAGPHRVEGGITMGGLKLLLRAMLEMGYQTRYSLLQAAHYGTPQRRVRFFLIAVQSYFPGKDEIIPLPELPQPTHDFPQSQKLQITLPNGDTVRPIRSVPGTAAHPFISIEDAIGDLPRFDWKRPGPETHSAKRARNARERDESHRTVPALVCNYKEAHCGYKGRVEYRCEPRTAYQKWARERPSSDLQHFTKTVLPKKVDRYVSLEFGERLIGFLNCEGVVGCNRVLAIPLNAGADYRSLRADMYEWQFANPNSSVAKKNYRPGLYGRLDKDGCFPTIVTNVDPTAKQSRVLHPYCKRMVTVRELARAQGFPDYFVFESYKGNVVTMHRQIGNAVPFPLARALGRELREVVFGLWRSGELGVDGERDGDSDADSNEGLYV